MSAFWSDRRQRIVVAVSALGLAARWDTIKIRIKRREVLQTRCGVRRRVENSVGCLSENRLFIRRGRIVGEATDSSWSPALD